MENRTKERKGQQVDNGGVADTDFRNLPTRETLSSLYISDQRIPYRRGESSHSGWSEGHVESQRRGSTTPTGTPGHVVESGDEGESMPNDQTRRRRHISSSSSMENNQDDTSTASMTPSTYPSISSGQSYSGEMNDELTPLREALPPSVSTRRRPITADTGYGNRRNVNASSSYAELPPLRPPPPLQPHLRPYDTSMPMPLYNPNAGLSEILASPTFREYQASLSPDYTASPFVFRRGSGTGSGGGSKPSTPKESGTAQVDYFTLPILREDEHDREIERKLEREGESPSAQKTHSLSSKTSSKSSSEAVKSGHNHEGTSTSTPSWTSSDVVSTLSSSLKSPRIRNEGMLAPHGSFTSDSGRQFQARVKYQRAQTQAQLANDNESVRSCDSVSSWSRKAASERSFDGSGRRRYSEEEYLDNVQAARGGDQLALYHLGWGPAKSNHRHNLGDAEYIWGGGDEPGSPSHSTRSSATSRASKGSNTASGPFPRHLSTGKSHAETLREALSRDGIPASRPDRKARTRSQSAGADLFADVAQMTLKSNADINRAQAQARPQPLRSSTPGTPIPGPSARPSLFKSASYVSSPSIKSSGNGKRETSEERKIRKARELGEGIVKEEEKDPEKEKEREKRRMARRAARVQKVDPSGTVEGQESHSVPHESEKKP